ncbi:uncharacterized protein LOC122886672 [Siniperca chuatsi]|uniref:uncharacterized protein LOC122886672 n=1 Tax=Siniperca chuatsi TaxID=119488 RepID=UPI001CE1EBAD|nr:uncharacterized protein LOC122886672 [Siniperca chuatsi]
MRLFLQRRFIWRKKKHNQIDVEEKGGRLVFSFYCSGRTLLICCLSGFNNSKDMLLYLFLLFSHFTALGSMNSIKPESPEEHVADGGNINLNCKYEGAIYNIQWYRQYQRSRPEFLLSITEGGSIHPSDSDFSAHINKTEKRVDLQIISAAVADSALYYCAVTPTVTGNTKTLYKNLWSKDNRILHNIHYDPVKHDLYDGDGSISVISRVEGRGSVTERSENTELRGDGEIQGGAELLLNYRRERNFHIQQSSKYKPQTLPLFNMLSLDYYGLSLLLLSILTGVSCEELTPVKNEEFSLEGSTVTLSCKYGKGAADYFFWYRQHPGKAQQFLISHLESGEILANPVSGLSVKVSEDKTRMDLQISSAAVTDSALYYCAVRPTVTGNPQSLYKNLTAPH